MWFKDTVIYTPEIISVTKGEPVEGVIENISADGTTFGITTISGGVIQVEKRLCEKK